MLSKLHKEFNLLKFNTNLILAGMYFTLIEKTYKVEGLDLVVPLNMTDIKFRGRFPTNYYERKERRYLKQYMPKNATVLELGACLGVISCLTNRLLDHPERQVVLEANPNLIPIIEQNKIRNKCGFAVEHCMISNQPSNRFFIGETIVMSSNLRQSKTEIVVPGKTIAVLERQYGMSFDVLVMDIEGGELEFLRENRDYLTKLNMIFIEVHPDQEILSQEEVTECFDILLEAGFERILHDSDFWILKKK